MRICNTITIIFLSILIAIHSNFHVTNKSENCLSMYYIKEICTKIRL
jgi:hypothetical protein